MSPLTMVKNIWTHSKNILNTFKTYWTHSKHIEHGQEHFKSADGSVHSVQR